MNEREETESYRKHHRKINKKEKETHEMNWMNFIRIKLDYEILVRRF